MGIFFLTEEPSIAPVIERFAADLLDLTNGDWFDVKIHQGKEDLRKALRTVVPTLSKIPDVRIMVLHDQDEKDCKHLKQDLADALVRCDCPLKIRIVCKELEAWFLGDLAAIEKAYPRFDAHSVKEKAKFRNVDEISRPSQVLLSIVPELSGLKSLPKIRNARAIAPHMLQSYNRSTSFAHFIRGIQVLSDR